MVFIFSVCVHARLYLCVYMCEHSSKTLIMTKTKIDFDSKNKQNLGPSIARP